MCNTYRQRKNTYNKGTVTKQKNTFKQLLNDIDALIFKWSNFIVLNLPTLSTIMKNNYAYVRIKYT